jgi:hypothetical protein
MSFSLPRLVWIRAQSQACRERRVFGTAPVARPHPSRRYVFVLVGRPLVMLSHFRRSFHFCSRQLFKQ